MPLPLRFRNLPARLRQLLSRKQDYRVVFLESEPGRRVLADLLQACGADRRFDLFAPGQADVTAYNLGKREIGERILRYLSIPDEDVIRMSTRHAQQEENAYGPDAETTAA